MAQLVDVVLDPPTEAGLPHQVGPHLASDDLIGPTAAARQDVTIEVAEHPLAHTVEGAVRAAHAHGCRDHEVLERVGLVGEDPRVPDGCRVPCRAEHHLGALVGRLARHLREHAVVADDQGQLAATRPLYDGDAKVARLPRLDRHPRVQLAVVEPLPTGVVEDEAGVEGRVLRATGIALHDGEATPDLVLLARCRQSGHLRPGPVAHDLIAGVH
mmetsp:Transcript_99550/g.277103  ORF Transcript_99550/g.277103 Transcript_99550/m.277103 type:complete len:214 (+) Transcript_99550:528-1169(+)